ncbi:MAG: hypothetical protein JWM75_971 [Sphingomonas bacterium]|nr:hypothetical protein [Sphingomonas bacterium]
MLRIAAVLLAIAPLAAAQAATPWMAPPVDPYQAAAIRHGQLDTAEARLKKEIARGSTMPEVRINLAKVYRATGRNDAAAALYHEVLAAPDVELVLSNGSVANAHALATNGLARQSALASRR